MCVALGQWGLIAWKSVRSLERRCAAGHASVSGLGPGDASGCAATLYDFRVFDLVFAFRFGKSKLAFRVFAFSIRAGATPAVRKVQLSRDFGQVYVLFARTPCPKDFLLTRLPI